MYLFLFPQRCAFTLDKYIPIVYSSLVNSTPSKLVSVKVFDIFPCCLTVVYHLGLNIHDKMFGEHPYPLAKCGS